MNFVFDNNTPIYIQLVEQMKIHIISGKLLPGERMPSVRDMALKLKVNPNTLQKALSELEEIGLIYTERTNGKFVTDDIKLIENYRKEYANSVCQSFFIKMEKIGLNKSEAVDYLKGVKE